VSITIILHNSLSEKQEQQCFSNSFSVLKINQLLRNAGIKKAFGLSALVVFQIIFQLVFLGKNWYRLLDSNRRDDLPSKDTIYRFLNHHDMLGGNFYTVSVYLFCSNLKN
jgi:hypothetical protein